MTARSSHRGLLRLTCLLLDVSAADGEHRLARAHRLTRRALRRRPFRRPSHPAARRRVVRHVVTTEQRPWPDRLHWRLRAEPLPLGGAAGRLQAEIRQLSPPDRAGYLLMQLEGLRHDEALDELRAAGERPVAGPDTVCDQIKDATGLGRQQQRELLAGADFDPAWVRLSRRPRVVDMLPRPTRRHLRGLGYAAVVLVVLAVATVPFLPERPGRTEQRRPWNDVVTVAADAWRTSDSPNYRGWPTAGEFRADQELIHEAARTWYGRAPDTDVTLVGWPPPAWWADRDDKVQILFAGQADGRTIVLMRQRELLARYERYLPSNVGEPRERLVVSPIGSNEGARRGVLLAVTQDRENGTRFVVPPWLTDLRVAPLHGDEPAWRPVKVGRGGLTEPLGSPRQTRGAGPKDRGAGETTCLDGFLVKGSAADGDGRTSTEVFLYRAGASQAATIYITRPDDTREVAPEDSRVVAPENSKFSAEGIDTPWVRRVLHGVVCNGKLLRRGFTPRSVGLDLVGHGDLPRGQGPASLLHLHVEYVGTDPFNTNRELTAALLTRPKGDGQTAPRVRVIERDRGPGSYQAVADAAVATWWQARSGRWYYLVAGYPQVDRIRLFGGIKRTVGRGFTAIRGPNNGTREDLPIVRVRVVDEESSPPAVGSE